MSRLIDADALEREGWSLKRNRQVDNKTMIYEVKKPTEFPTVEPEQPEVMSDGTLHITVDIDISKVDRILLSQKGTHYGNLYYVDDDEPERKTGEWIPCSETIDIPDHEVLCCDRYGEEMIGWLSYNDDQWLCESDGEMMYDPIAWREKPEPYKERREE